MRTFKKIITAVILLSLIAGLCGCGDGYVSSYRAVGLVRSNTSHSCSISFMSLEGQLVYKLRSSDGGEGDISYSLKVDEGEVAIYYDIYGSKEELISAVAGEEITDRGGYIEGGYTVYIIIEAKNGARGKVSVELD